MNYQRFCRIFFFILLATSFNSVNAQKFYIMGGGTFAWINNYNDDKGSEYFNESNYLGDKGFYYYTFGLGFTLNKSLKDHHFDFLYNKIGGIGTYREPERPQFGNVFPHLFVGEPDYQEQGFFATSISFKYSYQKEILADRLFLSIGGGDRYLAKYKNYNFISSSKYPYGQLSEKNSFIREQKYLNRHNLFLTLGVELKMTKLTSIVFSFDKHVTPINRKVDHIMIRKYYPNLLALMLRIYYN